jgi:hypothetical protein
MDLWEHGGRGSADDATIERMEAEANAAMADQPIAIAALEALVATLRAQAPHEIEAWVRAHQALIDGFLASDEAKGPYAEASVTRARNARAAWDEVRAGTRAYSDADGGYVWRGAAFVELFGLDPQG